MKTLLMASMAAAIAFFLIGTAPVASFGQCPCVLICPQGDGMSTPGPPGGTKSPDLNGDGIVNLVDLAMFAACFPPNPYCFCADYNCDGLINLVDLALFAPHWGHMGPTPGYNQPAIDHYKTYETLGPIFTGPIWLRDQFGIETIDTLRLAKFATPVSKNEHVICDSLAHQTWWEFRHPEPIRMIKAQDQFGTHDWMLGDAVYLLNPALKFPVPGDSLPDLNHYKCYEAQGPLLDIEVWLVDQFDQVIVIILEGRYFCNPCEKQTPDGLIHPIVDPWAHLTVYRVWNTTPYNIRTVVRDQFMEAQLFLFENLYLAVPALKTEVIEPGSSEWNRIKALYK